MIGRFDRRVVHVALAVLSLLAAGAVWVAGERRLDALRLSMWQQMSESLAVDTVEMLEAHAALAHFVGAVIPLTGLGDRFAAILNEMVLLHPDLRAIVVSDDTGHSLLETRHTEPSALSPAGDELQVVGSFAPLRAQGQGQGQGQTQGPVLVRTSEASNHPAMVGVGIGFQMPGWRAPGRVTLLTLGADMPSARSVKGRMWLIGHDDAVIAEPGLLTHPDNAASALDWTALRRAEPAAGMLQLVMEDGPHEILYRKLDPWPATLVVDTGRTVRPLIEPHGIAALALGALAVFLLRRAKGATEGQSGADKPVSDAAMASSDRDAMARRLAAGVAHTVNNVLTVLAFDAEMVGASAPGDERLQVLSRSMLCATAQGTQLTQRLLSYAERAVLRPIVVDLQVELVQRHDRLRSALDPGQKLLSQTLLGPTLLGPTLLGKVPAMPGRRLLVRVDPDALETCLMALLRNAADVTQPHAEITLELERTQLAGSDAVALVVDDAGPGMDAFTLAHAMEPGFSAQPDGQPDGQSDSQSDGRRSGRHLGLGLSAAMGFARQSGGQLTLESTPGLGTQARLLLPLVTDADFNANLDIDGVLGRIAAAGQRPQFKPAGSLPPAHRTLPRPKRILLVEDNVPVRDSIARRLRADGYDVVEAVVVADVLALVVRGVDVMVTDIVLADATDGWTLAARARELSPMLPLVFMSGFMSSRQPKLLDGDELASFVRKPVSGAELHTVIAGLLALHETRLIQSGPDAAGRQAT